MPVHARSRSGLVSQQKFMLKHDIQSMSGDRVEAVSLMPNRGDRTLSFFIPKTSNRLVNLSNIVLHLKLRLVSGLEGKPLDTKYDYFVPGFVPSTIFSNLAIRVNDTEITSNNQHALLSKFMFLTRLEPDRREELAEVNDFNGKWDEEHLSSRMEEVTDDEDEGGDGGEAADPAAQPKPKKKKKERVWIVSRGRFPQSADRSALFKSEGGRGTLSCCTYLLTELTGGGGDKDLILPPCDLAIDFHPADPSRAILCTHPNPDTRVEIVSAHLTVPRIQPKSDRILSLRWNFLRTKITPLIVPADRTEFHAVVLYSGLIGRRVSMFILDSDSWEGTYRSSLYRSYHNHVESVELRLGSRVIPTTRIRADFGGGDVGEMYMYVRESLKYSLRRSQAAEMMSKDRWKAGGFVWSGDTTVDHSAGAGFRGVPETGSVNLSIHFAKKTRGQLVLALILESTGELVIGADGAVSIAD